jgi:tRNA C32,U32 (ribose-2'-O)-methylase TrmJ
MAVQILTYELRLAGLQAAESQPEPDSPPATAGELEYFYEHLEQVLHASGFLDPDNPRLLMRRLRRLFVKAEPDKNEINILRGMLTALDPASPNGKGE